MELTPLILLILAVYRVALLLSREEGPFGVALWWRNRFLDDNWLGHGVRCLWCVAFWLSLGAALLAGLPWWWGLGMAGAVVVIDKVLER